MSNVFSRITEAKPLLLLGIFNSEVFLNGIHGILTPHQEIYLAQTI